MTKQILRSILFFLCVYGLAQSSACLAQSQNVGFLIDQPPQVVMFPQSDRIAELAQQIDRQNDSLTITLLNPTENGIVARDGSPVSLDGFDQLWIHQDDAIVQDSPLFSEAVQTELRQFLNDAPEHGVLLSGGAVALLDSLGFGPVQTAPVTFGEDREQSGLIPIQPAAAVFNGVQEDRGTLWITNAAFPAFENFSVESPNVRPLAQDARGLTNPLLAGTVSENGAERVKIIAFGWRISPLFDHAAEFFRTNFITLLTNLLNQTGKFIAVDDFIPPPFQLPDFDALQRGIDSLMENCSQEEYPDGETFLQNLNALREKSRTVQTAEEASELAAEFALLQKESLLANPMLDFDEILFIRRNSDKLGLPQNYNSNSVLSPTGYQNELCRLNFRTGETTTLYKPANDEFIGDLELHYDADKLMFSMPDSRNDYRWRLWELSLNSPEQPELLPLINDPDIDNYDACYLPDDRIVFCSTACQTGVPCINGSGHVCNLYLKEKDGSIRQLTLEQDHDWCPTVLNNGRIMYLRWEYTDLPHAFSRILFHMNPDGTNQSELYGSGSYWPNTMFYARPIPDHPTKFVAVIGGHHEQERRGDLVIFDPALGRTEAEGAIQRIPGYGKKVEPAMIDLPIGQTWPKFLHPYPLSENCFLVSCQRSAGSPWEICLVDTFDNIVTLARDPGFAFLEPIPIRETERQPVIPDRIRPEDPNADVFIANIYEGQGLVGVPPGTVRSIRILSYQFGYQGMGAEPYSVGLDGPWDPKRVLGTVPVNEDGSAAFKIPAYTPISLQPLDKDGKAIQIMRSWITAMPGESVSCIGCHEKQNSTSPTVARSIASQMIPIDMTPEPGANRGFSFEREIQPILDHYCVDCHQPDSDTVQKLVADGVVVPVSESELNATGRSTAPIPDFRHTPPKPLLDTDSYINQGSRFSNSYYQLRRYVRTPTKESQMPVHRPYEFHADTDYLVQLLEKGHFGVTLDQRSWSKLLTWIDLNAPYHGNWGDIRNSEIPGQVEQQWSRREELRKLYTGHDIYLDDDPTITRNAQPVDTDQPTVDFVAVEKPDNGDSAAASWKNQPVGERKPYTVSLSDGIELKMIPIPGTNLSFGECEITNQQYHVFDPTHDSGIEYGDFIQFSPGEKGWLLSRDKQPVVRVNWSEAAAFCEWLSRKTGKKFQLPTAEQWQFAALAGSSTPYWFGTVETDYSRLENLGDSSLSAIDPFGWVGRVDTLPAWRPSDLNRNDRSRVSAPVGCYQPNGFGLLDMQGNVSEWTDSEILLTKNVRDKQGNLISQEPEIRKIVCGGSWYTPIHRAGAGQERNFPADYNIYDVGFRVICVEE
ncbi:MAG: SUMF1/EgtB/PvdO family nonheme iron enzyme [Thermoguttaceae bacterium]|nr:SUMF1/EgtB/PvdO family nonheme iron enzyme [Thermoguttaceae bacterium]